MNKNKQGYWITLALILTSIFTPFPAQAGGTFDWLKKINYRLNTANEEKRVFPVVAGDNTLSLLHGTALISVSIPVDFNQSYTPVKTKTIRVLASAYSSTVDQTDNTPFITASGTHVRDGVAATNFLPLGTVFRIPKLFGEKVFIVEDRMNQRYRYHVDLWFPTRQSALDFGIKGVEIEIIS